MKKIISALLILTMIVSMVCVSTSAAGLYINANFDSVESFNAQFIPGAFFIEDNILFGYDEARALQSRYDVDENTFKWLNYDSSVTLAVADDDMSDRGRFVGLVYCNDNLYEYGRADGVEYMNFVYDIDDCCFRITMGGLYEYSGPGNDIDIVEPVYKEIPEAKDGEEFFTIGMSVEKDRMRCFYNDELIFDLNDTAREWLIADSRTSAFVYWQGGNFTQISNIKIADAGYLYPHATDVVTTEGTTTTAGGDNNVTTANTNKAEDATTTPKVTTTATSIVEVTNDKGEQVTDESGNKVTSQVVITEAPSTAATNTGKPAGGNATATGDATFAVVAAMVATLGCALIVKKVNA